MMSRTAREDILEQARMQCGKMHRVTQARQIEKAAEIVAREVATTYSDSQNWVQTECNCNGDASDGDVCEFCTEVEFYRGLIEGAFK